MLESVLASSNEQETQPVILQPSMVEAPSLLEFIYSSSSLQKPLIALIMTFVIDFFLSFFPGVWECAATTNYILSREEILQ